MIRVSDFGHRCHGGRFHSLFLLAEQALSVRVGNVFLYPADSFSCNAGGIFQSQFITACNDISWVILQIKRGGRTVAKTCIFNDHIIRTLRRYMLISYIFFTTQYTSSRPRRYK